MDRAFIKANATANTATLVDYVDFLARAFNALSGAVDLAQATTDTVIFDLISRQILTTCSRTTMVDNMGEVFILEVIHGRKNGIAGCLA